MPVRNPFQRSVRLKLLAITLLPMLVLLPLLLGTTLLRWTSRTDDLLIVKVNGDLTIADQYLAHLIESYGDRLTALSESTAFRDAAETGQLAGFIARKKDELGLDFLYVTTPDAAQDGTRPWPVITSAFAGKQQSAIDVFDTETLQKFSPILADRARITLIPTQGAQPPDRLVEDRGLVIHSAAPLALPDGGRAAVVGGILLNRNLDFIDTINNLVYSTRSLPEDSHGTATLFLDDVRISTNVRMFKGNRAIGTRVSTQVRSHVLENGQTWLDRAFVVNDWYLSGYEPIRDSFGKPVGMLYAGFLEAPFRQDRRDSMIGLAVLCLVISAISVPFFLVWAGRIFRPIERMTGTMSRVEHGDLAARIGPVRGEDEIAKVARHLDGLLEQVQERDRQLRASAATLEEKVEERTQDLTQAKEQLEQTTKQLVASEKLATIGEITASVAHEIYNPVAVIQGNLDVARSILGDDLTPVRAEFDLIDDQLYRISSIVSKFLQYARPDEFSGSENVLDVKDVIDSSLALVRHQIESSSTELMLQNDASAQILMDETELQQVLVNLVVNAVHAMGKNGRLVIASTDQVQDDVDGVEIVVTDSGHGMDAATLEKIFNPFFTTKRSTGTGLGLSISQSLVRRAGGTLSATSKPGTGSTFRIWLPKAAAV